MGYLTENPLIRAAEKVTTDAHALDIPLVADLVLSRHGPPILQVMHYNYGKDLSLSELRVVQHMVRVSALKHDVTASYTLHTLDFGFSPSKTPSMPEDGLYAWQDASQWPDQEAFHATRAAIFKDAPHLDTPPSAQR